MVASQQEEEEERAPVKKDEEMGAIPTMDALEETYESAEEGKLQKGLFTSKILDLESSENGIGLVVYVHEAAGLDPVGSGSGQAIVELSYTYRREREVGAQSALPVSTNASGISFPGFAAKKSEIEMGPVGASGIGAPTTTEVPVESLVGESSLRNMQQRLTDMSVNLNPIKSALVEKDFSFRTPEAIVMNGFASWGSCGRVLKLSDLDRVGVICFHVKVWQVVGQKSFLGQAKVLLGEGDLDIDLEDCRTGIEGIHDCELVLVNAWNEDAPSAKKEGGEGGEERDLEKGEAAHGDESDQEHPKLSVSWRLESLRGTRSDTVEMRISKLPHRGHSYAHGGFMGAAMSMMGEEKWRDILKDLEAPGMYRSCKSAWEDDKFAQKIKLMPLLENSPILCAYGLVRCKSLTMVESLSKREELSRVSISPFIANKEHSTPNASHASPFASAENSQREVVKRTNSGESNLYASYENEPLDTPAVTPGGSRDKANMSFLTIIATSESRAQMRWKLFAKRLLKIRKRWRFAIKAVIRQVRISMSWEKSQMGARVNRYGYSPVPLEWDLWVSPSKPWSIAHATVDHGSPAALVQQAIFSSLGLKKCAGMMGSKHIDQKGVPPVQWLIKFGEAINLSVNGDKKVPIPLHPESKLEVFHEIEVKLISGTDLVAMDITNTSDPYCKVYVKGDALYRKKQRSAVKASTLNPKWNELIKVWPVDPACLDLVLVIEVWDHDTTSGDDFMGKLEIHLSDLGIDESKDFFSFPLENDPSLGESLSKSKGSSKTSSPNSGGPDIGAITFQCKIVEKTVIEAAEDFEIPRHAFQTCLCMLSEPGGLFLDVKSAYSKAKHLSLFCTTLTGMGIHVKSVCSFSPSQLKLPPHEGVPSPVKTVRFFHGLSGLENACDNGQIPAETNVFFNGASFLMDPTKGDSEGGSLALARLGTLDTMYVNRYQALAETYKFNGGIYVQETDCCATCLESLTLLVSQRPDIFPLGFAYGHVPGWSVSSLTMRGRGFASQQIVEEFQARAELSGKVQRSIEQGQHKEVSLAVATSWLERLLYGSNFLYLYEQKLVLIMLGDIESESSLSKVVAHIGGVERIFLRFFEHYEATSPFTVHETGFNFNYTKRLCRFLRDRGVLERLSLERKVKLAKFFVSRACYGFGVTYFYQKTGLRKSIHKYAKEGLMCLLESCTEIEFDKIIESIGEMDRALVLLGGKWGLSRSYGRRLKAVQECHKAFPMEPHYVADMAIMRVSAVNKRRQRTFGAAGSDKSVSLDKKIAKTAAETARQTRKVLRKSACCVFTGIYVAIFTLASLTLYAWLYALPRTLWPYWGKGWNKQRFKGLGIIIGVLLLTGGLTAGVAVILWGIIKYRT